MFPITNQSIRMVSSDIHRVYNNKSLIDLFDDFKQNTCNYDQLD